MRLLEEQQKDHQSQWAAIQSIADKIGCTHENLRHWVRQSERDQGLRPGLSTNDREELKQLKRENRDLKRANEILRKASAYFAQAELDRRPKQFSLAFTLSRLVPSSRRCLGDISPHTPFNCLRVAQPTTAFLCERFCKICVSC